VYSDGNTKMTRIITLIERLHNMEANRAFAFKPEPRLQKKPPTPEEIPNSRFSLKKQPAVSTNPVGEARGSTDEGEPEEELKQLLSEVREELKHTFMQVAYNNSTLTRLDLSDIELSQSEITCLAKALETNSTLTRVELSKISMDISGMNTIVGGDTIRASQEAPINLVGEARGSTDVGKLEKILREILLKVREELKDTFMQVAYNNSTLTRLDLSNNQLSKPEVKCLAKVLKTNTTIQTLNLSNNQLDTSGITCLMDALNENKTLTILNLSKCTINIKGMKAIEKKRKIGRDPITIELGENALGHLGESLKGIINQNGGSLDTKKWDQYNWLRTMIDQNVDEYITIGGVGLREAYRYEKQVDSIIQTT
jgi:hypothetical protein